MKKGSDVFTFPNEKEATKFSANLVLDEIQINQRITLGLATGKTMIPFYKQLVSLGKKRKINFSNLKTFNLDEYVGVKNKKETLRGFMDRNFFSKVNIKKNNIYFLKDCGGDYKKSCQDFENKIKEFGGIDLQILGIGKNGHIGFNEPGSGRKSRTRKVKLKSTTRKSNAWFFHGVKKVPEYALTMGVGTILEARKVLLLAFGQAKAIAVERSLSGKKSSDMPASFLQSHPDSIFVVDKFAASKLR
jgi:glucosamine-6-phosphate deaminase